MQFLKDKKLMTLILTGIFINLITASLPGFQIDTSAWFSWAVRLNELGFSKFYSDEVWTNYTPGFLYVLRLLGFLREFFQLSDAGFYYLLKIPAIISEIILALIVYSHFAQKHKKWALTGVVFFLFNPAFIFNNSVWGQIDGLLSLFIFLAIFLLIKEKIIISSIFFALSFLIKPQTIAFLPLLLLFLIKNFSLKSMLKITLAFSLTLLLFAFPFFPSRPLVGILDLFTKMVSDYPYTSLFAYNLWGTIGFWIKDNLIWNSLTLQLWGQILFASYWVYITYLYLKRNVSIYTVAALAALAFFFLPTRVHERYLYPGLVFLIYVAIFYKSKILLIFTGILSILHFFNLYYVYVYYNEVFLNLPRFFYNPFIYNFLDAKSREISAVSTIIFILINIVIINYYAIFKKS